MDTPDFTIPDDRVTDAPSENVPKSKKTRRSRYDPEPDWSAMVRAKVTKSQHRVGQACDRCKVWLPYVDIALNLTQNTILTHLNRYLAQENEVHTRSWRLCLLHHPQHAVQGH